MSSNIKTPSDKITKFPYKQKEKELFPEVLEKNHGRIYDTCRELNISAETFYQWKRSDPIFKKSCKEVEYRLVDYVENKLWEHIESGCVKSLLYFLRSKGRKRGWDPKIDPDYNNEDRDFIDYMR